MTHLQRPFWNVLYEGTRFSFVFFTKTPRRPLKKVEFLMHAIFPILFPDPLFAIVCRYTPPYLYVISESKVHRSVLHVTPCACSSLIQNVFSSNGKTPVGWFCTVVSEVAQNIFRVAQGIDPGNVMIVPRVQTKWSSYVTESSTIHSGTYIHLRQEYNGRAITPDLLQLCTGHYQLNTYICLNHLSHRWTKASPGISRDRTVRYRCKEALYQANGEQSKRVVHFTYVRY